MEIFSEYWHRSLKNIKILLAQYRHNLGSDIQNIAMAIHGTFFANRDGDILHLKYHDIKEGERIYLDADHSVFMSQRGGVSN
jgi:hypothetical protein